MFITPEVSTIFNELKPQFRKLLLSLNSLNFHDCDKEINELRGNWAVVKNKLSASPEKILNELYIINKYVDMLAAYSAIWEKIFKMEFSSSWSSLQDCLDFIRLIKRFCELNSNTDYFEDQLLQLEKLYPYNVFMSIGAIVEWFKCSICGKDIDSLDCLHVKGKLYMGQLAYAVAQNIKEFNHVSVVEHPKDKRCVVIYDDTGEQFKAVRFLSNLIRSKELQILHFGELKYSKKISKNPNYKKIGRNELCYCGSGKKFKNCCAMQEFIETDHVDIVPQPVEINQIVP